MQYDEYRKGQCEKLIMDYSFFERLTGSKSIAGGLLAPKCDMCRTRTQKWGAPQLFLLPVYQDHDYTPSADYYSRNCRPISKATDIPIGQRACRMWQFVCPECGARAVSIVDFLLVRGQEITEKLVVCDYAPLAGLLNDFSAESAPVTSGVRSFGYKDTTGNGRKL